MTVASPFLNQKSTTRTDDFHFVRETSKPHLAFLLSLFAQLGKYVLWFLRDLFLICKNTKPRGFTPSDYK